MHPALLLLTLAWAGPAHGATPCDPPLRSRLQALCSAGPCLDAVAREYRVERQKAPTDEVTSRWMTSLAGLAPDLPDGASALLETWAADLSSVQALLSVADARCGPDPTPGPNRYLQRAAFTVLNRPITSWPLVERCQLATLLTRQVVAMQEWADLDRYVVDHKARMVVFLYGDLGENRLIGPGEVCEVSAPTVTRRSGVRVTVAGDFPYQNTAPYLTLTWNSRDPLGSQPQTLRFTRAFNVTWWGADEPPRPPDPVTGGAIGVVHGAVYISVSAPILVIEVRQDEKEWVVTKAAVEYPMRRMERSP